MSNRTTISLSIPPAADAALDRLAARLGRKRSVIVAELVMAADADHTPSEPSCAAVLH